MTLSPGTRLGPYEITGAIGAGGMGEVYRGRDAALNRDVAIKVLPAAMAADPERLARFKREAQVLASLNHPNIAAIFGMEVGAPLVAALDVAPGEDRERAGPRPAPTGPIVALVMELVEGEDLAERLKRGAIPVDEAITIAKQIAEGVEEAHEHGIIHRDLKPANIKVTPDGKVKILDFGLAKALEGDPSSSAANSQLSNSPTMSRHMTEAGMIMGTAAYMSPEQARGKPVDRRADIWSFGVVMFEMLTGTRLFAGETVSDVLAAVLTRDPDLNLLPAGTSRAVRGVIRRCLDRDPRKRLHDIADARILIEEKDAHGGPSDAVGGAHAGMNRRTALVGVAVLVSVGVLAGVSGYVVSGRGGIASPPMHLAIQLSANQQVGGQGNSLFTFSPDGRSLVFSGRQDGRETLFRREIGDREALPIPGTEGGTNPAFSPDGKWLSFSGGGQLRKVAVAGGRPFPLADALGAGGSAWLDDHTIIFAPIYSSGLYRVSTEGGVPEELTKPNRASGELGHWWPEPLPGGRLVLFTAFRTPVDRSRIGILDLQTREVRWLVEGGFFARYAPSGHLLYAQGLRLFAVPFDAKSGTVLGPAVAVLDDVRISQTSAWATMAVSSQGTLAYVTESLGNPLTQLIWLDRTGRETPVTTERRRYMSVSLAPEGERAALTIQSESQDLWILSLSRGALSRLTSGPATEYGPLWSPDGRTIFYVLDRPPYEIHRMEVGAPDSGRPLWDEPALLDTYGMAVSPDGRNTAFVRVEELTSNNIYFRPTDGSAPPRPIRATRAVERGVSFSPDGRFVAYESNETGRPEVYAQSFPDPKDRTMVSADGGTEPLWAGNGEIFYRHDSEIRVAAPRSPGRLEFDQPRTLYSVNLTDFTNSDARTFAVTRDGARILAITTPLADQPRQIEVVTNWLSELTRLAPRGK